MLDWLGKALRPGPHRASQENTAIVSSSSTSAAFSAHGAGDWQQAVTLLQPLARERADDAQVQYLLGDALYQLDRVQEALAPLEQAVRIAGSVAAYHYKLGNVLKDLQRMDEALACYRSALQLDPGHAQALNNTGLIAETQGRIDDALGCYRKAVLADGTLLAALGNLAILLHRQERYSEATETVRALLRAHPRSASEWGHLGSVFLELGHYDDAIRYCERALEGATVESGGLGLPDLLNNIAAAHKQIGALETAASYFNRAIDTAPQFALARINLATVRHSLGLVDEAIAGYRHVMQDDPHNALAARYLLMALLYTHASAESLFEEHLAFGMRMGTGTRALPAAMTGARPGNALRIGYVSSDWRGHPVAYNMLPVIREHDRGAVEVYLYSGVKHPDDMTRWFSEHADAWRTITNLSDEAAARLIQKDRVDILVLLAGRFDDNRPLLATYRPAPVIVSLHDPATSGLREIDYLIADRGLVPRHSREKFTERVVCLPTFYVHPPLDDAPRRSEPPAARNGWITFGSFNNPAKINERVVAVWAQVLQRVPGSRLLLKYMNAFKIPAVRSRILEQFDRHGIGGERLLFPDAGRDGRREHLARYEQIDIALDPFPFTGSTTTFEALCVGIPVVTLQGERMVSRWSVPMLAKVGLSRLVARNEADYIGIAAALASDIGELTRLRTDLPGRVVRSPLCAGQARTRQLERLYRRMWAIRLARHSSSPDARASAPQR